MPCPVSLYLCGAFCFHSSSIDGIQCLLEGNVCCGHHLIGIGIGMGIGVGIGMGIGVGVCAVATI